MTTKSNQRLNGLYRTRARTSFFASDGTVLEGLVDFTSCGEHEGRAYYFVSGKRRIRLFTRDRLENINPSVVVPGQHVSQYRPRTRVYDGKLFETPKQLEEYKARERVRPVR